MKHNSNSAPRLSSIVKKNGRLQDDDQSSKNQWPNRIIEDENNITRRTSKILSADISYIKTKADEDRPE